MVVAVGTRSVGESTISASPKPRVLVLRDLRSAKINAGMPVIGRAANAAFLATMLVRASRMVGSMACTEARIVFPSVSENAPFAVVSLVAVFSVVTKAAASEWIANAWARVPLVVENPSIAVSRVVT